MKKTFHILCPDCNSELEIDAETGLVLQHHRQTRPPAVDLDQVGEQLRRQERERNERFRQSVLAEKQKDERLRRKFDDALRRVQENPEMPPPIRDFDLD